MNDFDAIVVGGGHNGLVSSMYLARAGLRVLVIERRSELGGPCGPVDYFPGYRNSITNSPGSLDPSIVAELELAKHGLEFTNVDPTLVMPLADGSHFVAWQDQRRVVEQLERYSKHDAVEFFNILKFFDDFAKTIAVSPYEPPPSLAVIAARLKTPADEDAFAKIFFGSLKDLLDERLESDSVKALLAIRGVVSIQAGPSTPGTPLPLLMRPLSLLARGASSGNDPRLAPLRGTAGYPKGGMVSIIAAMERGLRAHGATVLTGIAVSRVLVENGAVVGVEVAGGRCFRAPIVASNLNPKTTLLELVGQGELPDSIERRVRAKVMRGAAFKVALALDRPPRYRFAANDNDGLRLSGCQFRIAPSVEYMDRAFDDARYGKPSSQPLIWGLCPTLITDGLAPPGHHLLSLNIWHAPYALREGSWDTERDRFGQRCVDLMEEYMPGLKDSIVNHRYWSPVDLEREYGLVEGNIIQGDGLPSQMFSLRPVAGVSGYRTPIDGLYLCGVGTWPGGYVSGIPGHNAGKQILRDLKVAASSPVQQPMDATGG